MLATSPEDKVATDECEPKATEPATEDCGLYCVLSTKLHFTHLREAAGFPVTQVVTILCFIDETALHAPQGGRRIPRHTGGDYTVFY